MTEITSPKNGKKSKKNRNILLLSAFTGIALSILLYGCNKEQKNEIIPEHVLVYAENQPEDYPTTKGAYYFSDLVYERTGGRIKIIVKCNGEEGDEKSVIEQMEFGGVDCARVSLSSLSDNIDKLKVIQMPYLYTDADAMWSVLDGEIGDEFAQAIEDSDYGIKALSWYDAGARNFYSVKPIEDISDIAGLNIRVQQSDMMANMVELLGGVPVKMIYSEVYMALKTGKIDAAENSFTAYRYSRHYEQARYCITDEHVRVPEVQLISKKIWDKLTDEEKDIISECAKESAIYERNLWQSVESEAKEELIDKGITITEISDEDRNKLREKLKPLYDEYCKDYMDIIDRIKSMQE